MTIEGVKESVLEHFAFDYVTSSNTLMNELLEPNDAIRLEELKDESCSVLCFMVLEALGYSLVDNEGGLGCKWQKNTK